MSDSQTSWEQEWIDKAEADFRVACREAAVQEEPSYDSVCFHIQQCLEKYLKALLVRHGLPVPRTHDLLELIGLLSPRVPSLMSWLNDAVAEINLGAVEIRYPGATTSQEDVAAQLETCRRFRQELRTLLSCPPEDSSC